MQFTFCCDKKITQNFNVSDLYDMYTCAILLHISIFYQLNKYPTYFEQFTWQQLTGSFEYRIFVFACFFSLNSPCIVSNKNSMKK